MYTYMHADTMAGASVISICELGTKFWSSGVSVCNCWPISTGPSFLEKHIVRLLNGAHCIAVLIALLCRHEDLGLNPQNPYKKDILLHIYNLDTPVAIREGGQEKPQKLTDQPWPIIDLYVKQSGRWGLPYVHHDIHVLVLPHM